MADLSPQDLVTLTDGLDKPARLVFHAQFSSVKKDRGIATMLAIVFGFDRFYLGQIGLGLLKWATFMGFGLWWLIDIFTAAGRTDDFNRRKSHEIVNTLRTRPSPSSDLELAEHLHLLEERIDRVEALTEFDHQLREGTGPGPKT